jgi:GGDEF domain-containing protein
MEQRTYQKMVTKEVAASNDFAIKIQQCMQQSQASGRFFFIVLLQVANLNEFRKKRPPLVVKQLLREIGMAVRQAVHSSQFVGYFQDGLGLVFDAVDPGQVDTIAQRLIVITQNTIRKGKYNDLSSRWTDIIFQFLHPSNPGILFPCVGWAVYPRDGENDTDLVRRALCHIQERERKKDNPMS